MGSFTAPSWSVPASLGSCSLCALLEGWKTRSLLKREVPSKDTSVWSTTLIICKQLEDNKEINRPGVLQAPGVSCAFPAGHLQAPGCSETAVERQNGAEGSSRGEKQSEEIH